MNIRCKCEWCEPWNQGEEFEPHPSHGAEAIAKMKVKHAESVKYLENKREPLERVTLSQLSDMVDEALDCSGPFENSDVVHSLALGVKCLLVGI